MNFNILRMVNIFDSFLLCAIRKYLKNKYLDKLMPLITSMGNLGIVWIVISMILMLNKQYKLIGSMVLLTLIISTIIGEGIIKNIIRRIRPCNHENNITLLIKQPLSYSFPSGHTLSSFAVAEVLSIYFSEYMLIFMAIAFLIALSRLYLYVHYPTDIIAGVIIGLLCSKLVFLLLQKNYLEKADAFLQNIF